MRNGSSRAGSGVLVVEAGVTSGTLVTADFAARLGVPVWVPPPYVGARREGIDGLLRAGHAAPWTPGCL